MKYLQNARTRFTMAQVITRGAFIYILLVLVRSKEAKRVVTEQDGERRCGELWSEILQLPYPVLQYQNTNKR